MQSFFLNLKMSAKLLLSFSIITVVCLIVGLVGILNILQLQELDHDLYTFQTRPLLELRIINGGFEQNRAYMRDIIAEDNPQKISEYISAMEVNTQKIDQAMQKFSQSLLSETEKEDFVYFSNVLENFNYHKDQVVTLCKAGNKKYAHTVLLNDGPKLSLNFNKAIEKLAKTKEDIGREKADFNEGRAQIAVWFMGTLVLFSFLLAAGLSVLIARMISRPIESMVIAANRIAKGDLAVEIPQNYPGLQDEIGKLGMAFKVMTENLRTIVKQVYCSSEQVASASEELTASSGESAQVSGQIATAVVGIAKDTDKQLHTVSKTMAIVGQMSTGVERISSNSLTAAITADKTVGAAVEGGESIELVISKMNDIENIVNHSATVISKLDKRSKEIGEIVDTISGIASQTNLLALNAAIEAARAGEQGRGFAVVAEEVRKLAEQSQAAAKEIADIIHKTQVDTGKAAEAMGEGTREVKAGSQLANLAGTAFNNIIEMVQQVSSESKEISTAITLIAQGNQFVLASIHELDEVSRSTSAETQLVSAATQEQSATLEEIASSSETLAQLAEQLKQAVTEFKI
ncbi:methyl-accepting chemotaxis protein [Sporomusa sp.]|uniref:methyl-accepting chemotaxis protein n=1 Tax=Sporomusa sp. TaxID=2078658 RepID=UPI002D809012|nr:methyl-accepting chemotaxis protein [Sporomusa sp.]